MGHGSPTKVHRQFPRLFQPRIPGGLQNVIWQGDMHPVSLQRRVRTKLLAKPRTPSQPCQSGLLLLAGTLQRGV